MPKITYTAQGTFDRNRMASINVCIPAEPSSGAYVIEMYNLSKNTSNGIINVIFCHFSDGSTEALQHESYDFRLNFDLDKLKTYSGSVPFDENNSEALFLFFHDTDFNVNDRNTYFSKIENIYNQVKNQGNQSQDEIANKTNNSLSSPRKVGMSLVTKSGS